MADDSIEDRQRMPPPRHLRQAPPSEEQHQQQQARSAAVVTARQQTQRALSLARHARVGGTFLGEERRYTRHVLYADEEEDFNADAHDLMVSSTSRRRRRGASSGGGSSDSTEALYTSKRAPSGEAQRPSEMAARLYEDPTAEAGDRPMLEDPDTIMQFRDDMRSTALADLLASNKLVSHERARARLREGVAETAEEREEDDAIRMRGHVSATRPFADSSDALEDRRKTVETVRAIRRARTNQTLLSIDYTRYLPRPGIEAFLRADETRHILRVLLPRFYVDEEDKQHILEQQLIWDMASIGCKHETTTTHVIQGTLRSAVMRNVACDYYTEERMSGEHTHYDESSSSTTMRIVSFRCIGADVPRQRREALPPPPPHRVRPDDDILREAETIAQSEARSGNNNNDDDEDPEQWYSVHVVCHATGRMFRTKGDKKDAQEFLCFRTFYFSR